MEFNVSYERVSGVCDCCGTKSGTLRGCWIKTDVSWFLCPRCLEFVGGILPVVGCKVKIFKVGGK